MAGCLACAGIQLVFVVLTTTTQPPKCLEIEGMLWTKQSFVVYTRPFNVTIALLPAVSSKVVRRRRTGLNYLPTHHSLNTDSMVSRGLTG